jgi:hypothetical protein
MSCVATTHASAFCSTPSTWFWCFIADTSGTMFATPSNVYVLSQRIGVNTARRQTEDHLNLLAKRWNEVTYV